MTRYLRNLNGKPPLRTSAHIICVHRNVDTDGSGSSKIICAYGNVGILMNQKDAKPGDQPLALSFPSVSVLMKCPGRWELMQVVG